MWLKVVGGNHLAELCAWNSNFFVSQNTQKSFFLRKKGKTVKTLRLLSWHLDSWGAHQSQPSPLKSKAFLRSAWGFRYQITSPFGCDKTRKRLLQAALRSLRRLKKKKKCRKWPQARLEISLDAAAAAVLSAQLSFLPSNEEQRAALEALPRSIKCASLLWEELRCDQPQHFAVDLGTRSSNALLISDKLEAFKLLNNWCSQQ